jgi:pimeloyl-ACP methyl ester carboxylesterase
MIQEKKAPLRRIALVLFLSLAAGCALLQPIAVPMPVIERSVGPAGGERILLVLLHGRGDRAARFFEKRFDEIARETGRSFHLVAAEAHLGYYMKGQVETRIREDILVPARKQGFSQVWLVGVSMGGLGALAVAERHPEEIDGVIVLAPYLGSPKVLDSVSRGAPLPERLGAEDVRTKELWAWLRSRNPETRPRILVGVGESDRFLESNRLLAGLQPPGRFVEIPGGHDWTTWKALFRWALDHPAGPGR